MQYVLSDIHGESAAFDAILAMIHLQPEDHLYIIGDVIDRGSDGIALLRSIREMPNATLLMGNHEYMMIDALRHPKDKTAVVRWWMNGCEETLRRFYDLLPQAREELLRYLESLPVQIDLSINVQNYRLVHAAPLELYKAGRWKDEKVFAVWQRIPLAPQPLGDRPVLIGHTPTRHVQRADWPRMRIAHGDGVIDLDCGCVFPEYGGQLGCLRLEDGMEFYSEEGPVTAEEAAEWKARYVQAI